MKKQLPLILRQNPIKSLKMWKEGFSKLTPMQHALAKRDGHFWAIFGATGACSFILLQIPYATGVLSGGSRLGFAVFIGAIAFLQFVEWRKENQKINGLKKMNQAYGASEL